MQKPNLKILILAIIVVLAIACGIFWWQKDNISNLFFGESPKACKQEAKLCPDGSYVGRTGPNCEFAPCPEVKAETANWKTFKFEYKFEKGGCQINYPKDWEERGQGSLAIFYSQDKPPIIFSIVAHKLTIAEETKCIPSFYKDIGVRVIGKEVINGLNFCKMTRESEGDVVVVYYNAIKNDNNIGDIGDTVCDIGLYYSGYYQGKDPLLSDKNEGEMQTLKKMLSTFKFIE